MKNARSVRGIEGAERVFTERACGHAILTTHWLQYRGGRCRRKLSKTLVSRRLSDSSAAKQKVGQDSGRDAEKATKHHR